MRPAHWIGLSLVVAMAGLGGRFLHARASQAATPMAPIAPFVPRALRSTWTVDGLQLGMSARNLGLIHPSQVASWKPAHMVTARGDVTVVFDGTRNIFSVLGRRLEHNGHIVLECGDRQSDMFKRLGVTAGQDETLSDEVPGPRRDLRFVSVYRYLFPPQPGTELSTSVRVELSGPNRNNRRVSFIQLSGDPWPSSILRTPWSWDGKIVPPGTNVRVDF